MSIFTRIRWRRLGVAGSRHPTTPERRDAPVCPSKFIVADSGEAGAPGLFLDLSAFSAEQWADLIAAVERVVRSFGALPGEEEGR
jgi:hypothetical protein